MKHYRSVGKKYNYTFDGDDQLVELGEGIRELTEENQTLRKRLKAFHDAARSDES